MPGYDVLLTLNKSYTTAGTEENDRARQRLDALPRK